MIPTFIFNQEQLQQAIKACDNNISALEISNFTDFEKLYLEAIYTDLRSIYDLRLRVLQKEAKEANAIKTTFESIAG